MDVQDQNKEMYGQHPVYVDQTKRQLKMYSKEKKEIRK
jgi:hypothetical protein